MPAILNRSAGRTAFLLLCGIACLPAHAAVNTIATFDEFTFWQEEDPYGTSFVYGPAYGTGYNQANASIQATNPSGFGYDFEGSLSTKAYASEGINKAWAWVESQELVLDGDRLVGAQALAGWHEQVVVSGGTGQGTLTLTARLDGQITVWGERNAQGLSGRGLASINYLKSDAPLTPDFDIFQGELAFPCADDEPCTYDRTRFTTLGGLYVESDESLVYDQSLSFEVDFEYDKPFYLYGTLEVASYGFNVGAGAETDFFNTGRITGFTAPQGATVTLGSGNYEAFTLPVPEPMAWLQALAGLGTLGAVAAWRRRRA